LFVLENRFLFPFILGIQNSRYTANPSKNYFNIPPGPCANHSINDIKPLDLSPLSLLTYFGQASLYKSLLGMAIGYGGLSNKEASEPESESDAPVPPTLHQYFQSDYSLGYGALLEKNMWAEPNSVIKGHMTIDKETGGFFVNIDDDQDANVPFIFSTNIIGNPKSPKNVAGYMFLHPGRCWISPYPLINPDFPLSIPSDATYLGEKVIYGQTATLWQFTDEVYGGYSGTFEIAVASADKTLLFITGGSDIYGIGSYLVFKNFNNTRPDPDTYAAPVGYCYDPIHGGPPS